MDDFDDLPDLETVDCDLTEPIERPLIEKKSINEVVFKDESKRYAPLYSNFLDSKGKPHKKSTNHFLRNRQKIKSYKPIAASNIVMQSNALRSIENVRSDVIPPVIELNPHKQMLKCVDFCDQIFVALKSIVSIDKLQEKILCQQHRLEIIIGPANTLCSTCCWPKDIRLAFISKQVQKAMIKEIQKRLKIRNLLDKSHQNTLILFIGRRLPSAVKSKFLSLMNDEVIAEVEDEEPGNGEIEDFGLAETFFKYKPKKLTFGLTHPDKVVETSSLSAVEPPDITYKLSLPPNIITDRKLSALQLETVVYANQRFENRLADGSRAGFLIGDGAGVGKGRTIAGCIFENYLKNFKKAIWVSVSSDLKYDAERDLQDIGASHIKVRSLSKMSYKRIDHFEKGVLFCTYMSLIGKKMLKHKVRGMFTDRMEQILDWCGPDFNGIIVFDESHRAKNLISNKGLASTKTGLAVFDLQNKLPDARIFYASATGASQPKDMGYMVRLGIWGKRTPFSLFKDFQLAIDKRGVAGMEIAALDMKLRGAYLARQLAFDGVTFRIEEVPLTAKIKKGYDASVKLWTKAFHYFNEAYKINEMSPKQNCHKKALFFAVHQTFFKLLCIASKVGHLVDLVKEVIKEGKCAVIGLQLTGESNFIKQLAENDNEVFRCLSTAKGTMEIFLKNHFPCDIGNHCVDDKTKKAKESLNKSRLLSMKTELLKDLEEISKNLPPNTLDEVINRLGGKDKVAELTGRKCRVNYEVGKEYGATYELRKDGYAEDLVNMTEKMSFESGSKLIAIISEAASSGISLHSDKRFTNQRKRVHITLELPWSADRAIQQFGRTHRSNQTCPPEYVLLISDFAGERRFSSCVAKRLESLGALTHGDRRASEARDLSEFNIDSKYGLLGLRQFMEVVLNKRRSSIPLPEYSGNFYKDVREALNDVGLIVKAPTGFDNYALTRKVNVSVFLNRLLGTPVSIQNKIFTHFMDNVDSIIENHKAMGKYDNGILDLGIGGQSCERLESERREWQTTHSTGTSKVVLHSVAVTRGLSFEQALEMLQSHNQSPNNSFYLAKNERNNKKMICLALQDGQCVVDRAKHQKFCIYRPHVGQSKPFKYFELIEKYTKVSSSYAKRHWENLYNHSSRSCLHSYWSGFCKHGSACRVGVRKTKYYILCGSVFTIWSQVESVIKKVQVIRLKTNDGNKLVGITIPWYHEQNLKKVLDEEFSNVEINDDIDQSTYIEEEAKDPYIDFGTRKPTTSHYKQTSNSRPLFSMISRKRQMENSPNDRVAKRQRKIETSDKSELHESFDIDLSDSEDFIEISDSDDDVELLMSEDNIESLNSDDECTTSRDQNLLLPPKESLDKEAIQEIIENTKSKISKPLPQESIVTALKTSSEKNDVSKFLFSNVNSEYMKKKDDENDNLKKENVMPESEFLRGNERPKPSFSMVLRKHQRKLSPNDRVNKRKLESSDKSELDESLDIELLESEDDIKSSKSEDDFNLFLSSEESLDKKVMKDISKNTKNMKSECLENKSLDSGSCSSDVNHKLEEQPEAKSSQNSLSTPVTKETSPKDCYKNLQLGDTLELAFPNASHEETLNNLKNVQKFFSTFKTSIGLPEKNENIPSGNISDMWKNVNSDIETISNILFK